MTTKRELHCSLLLAEANLAKIRFHANIKANRKSRGILMSRNLCYHGYETASRRISGFVSNTPVAKFPLALFNMVWRRTDMPN